MEAIGCIIGAWVFIVLCVALYVVLPATHDNVSCPQRMGVAPAHSPLPHTEWGGGMARAQRSV